MEEEISLDETIKNRKKLSPKIRDTIITSIFYNTIVLIVMLLITFGINIMFNKAQMYDFRTYMKYIQMVIGIVSIVFFEISYRKDSGKMAIYAIEFSLYSIAILYVNYMYILKEKLDFLRNVVLAFTIYYLVKSIVVSIYYRHNYIKNNISDVKEIVKEEKKGYIDEESNKTLKERRKEQEELKKKLQETKQKLKKEPKQKKEKKAKIKKKPK